MIGDSHQTYLPCFAVLLFRVVCTTGLLEEATESCECYSFCGKDFAGCEMYPGQRLTANNCDERAVSGCNYAAAFEGPNPFLLCPG
jgi:hypothetical protein